MQKQALYRRTWLLILLCIPALGSLLMGVRRSLLLGIDFQWPGAYLLVHRQDPWLRALQNKAQLTTMVGTPNYLHELYVALIPLTALSFHHAGELWSLLGILLTIPIVLLLGNMFALDRRARIFLALLFISGVSFRDCLASGQFSFVELTLFCLIYSAASPLTRGVALGLSFAKYSFSPVVAFTFFARKRFLILLIALIPPVLGLGICMWLLNKPPWPLAVEPFVVAREGVSPSYADLMVLLERVLAPVLPSSTILSVEALTALAAAALYATRLTFGRQLRAGAELCCVAVATLVFFRHLLYDYMFLIIPVAFALSPAEKLPRWTRWTITGVVGYVWFGSTLIGTSKMLQQPLGVLLFNVGLMLLLLFAVDHAAGNRAQPPPLREAASTRPERGAISSAGSVGL